MCLRKQLEKYYQEIKHLKMASLNIFILSYICVVKLHAALYTTMNELDFVQHNILRA